MPRRNQEGTQPMSKMYQIGIGANVTIQEETLDAMRTIPWSVDYPLWFDEDELVEVMAGKYHFRHRMRHYFANVQDVKVLP